MDLPSQIAIRPLARPVSAVIRPPGSKSFTNRALVTAALAKGGYEAPRSSGRRRHPSHGVGVAGIRHLDRRQRRSLARPGLGWGSRPRQSAPVDAGMSGTTARFLVGVASLVRGGPVTITGRGRMMIRPQEELIAALAAAGVDGGVRRRPSPGHCLRARGCSGEDRFQSTRPGPVSSSAPSCWWPRSPTGRWRWSSPGRR